MSYKTKKPEKEILDAMKGLFKSGIETIDEMLGEDSKSTDYYYNFEHLRDLIWFLSGDMHRLRTKEDMYV